MGNIALTDAEKSGLSEEEQAALADDDELDAADAAAAADADTAAAAVAADEEAADAAAAAKNGEDKDAADAAAAEKAAAAATDDDPDAVAKAAAEADSPVSEEFNPRIEVEAVEDYDGKMTAFDEQKAGLLNQFNDGDIDMSEYQEQRDVIEKDIRKLERDNDRAINAAEQNSNSNLQRWQWEQDRFFGDEANKIYKDNTMLASAFDTRVKELAADENNGNRSMQWFLEEADRNVRAVMLGKSAPVVVDDKDKNNGKRPAADLSKIPPNLGDVPAADLNEAGDDAEFAFLDKLDGMEFEAALAKMSQAQADRYLKG